MCKMNISRYEEVESEKESTKSVLKQILISSSVWVQYFMAGLCVGAPTVLIPQMRKEANSTEIINGDLASWLYSTSGFATYPWIIILPLVTQHCGRKPPQVATSVCSLIIFLILYFSQNPYHIIVSEIFQGFLFGGNVTIRVLTVAEYTSPKYRGIFLAIKAASLFWGLWVANAIGTFFPWKNIAVLGFLCAIYTFNVFFWPESPYWLASKGRFEECKSSFRSIHGNSEKSEKLLQEIIAASEDVSNNRRIGFLEMFKNKEFYMPISICVLTVVQYHLSGKLACTIYILDIFNQLTKDKSTAYTAMLILDGITVFGLYLGSFVSRFVKRRTLYMTSSFAGILLLFVTSLYLYLAKLDILNENSYVTIALLTLYSLSISCGPLILSLAIYGEVIPRKFQGSCYVITGATFAIFYSWLVKLTPLIFKHFAVHGSLLFFGIACGLCTIYLYVYMPETKNKTQMEIEEFFKDKRASEEEKPLQRNK